MIDGSELISLLSRYYALRGLQQPTTGEALDWCITEIAEARHHLVMSNADSQEMFQAVAELIEAMLRVKGGWVRNNPAKNAPLTRDAVIIKLHEISALAAQLAVSEAAPREERVLDHAGYAEELGDALMMLMVAGLEAGIDPIAALAHKINRKTGLE